MPRPGCEAAQASVEYAGLIVAVALLMAGVASWAGQRNLVDHYAQADLAEFLAYKESGSHDPRLDYTDDGCSAPVVGSTGRSFDFTEACERHDFGYRNYKRLGLFAEEKDAVDERFLGDMLDHCTARRLDLQARCRNWAYVFFAGVTVFGWIA